MTKAEQKADRRRSLLRFLEHWDEGPAWRIVEETNARHPEFLLQRVDGSETVGVEIRNTSLESLARIRPIVDRATEELQNELRLTHVDHVAVLLYFHADSVLVLSNGRSVERRVAVKRIAQLIKERVPLLKERNVIIPPHELDAEGIRFINVVYFGPAEELLVLNHCGPHGAHCGAYGDDGHILQPYIDEHSERLPVYRSHGAARSAEVCPSARFTGVWFIVTLMDGQGLSSSITQAETEPKRRSFDRVFLLDNSTTERPVIELLE